ncbi:MAG: M23 family metallopeptidase [Thermoflexibacter sp.]|nr:M23 family metallopeptidase [Thermoflexibacter sp.]
MARIKYYYDTETCKFEPIKTSTSDIVINFAGFLIFSLVISIGLVSVYVNYFPSEREADLAKENQQLLLKYNILNTEIANVSGMLKSLQERDDKVYRVVFEAEPIPMEIRSAGTGGTEKYRDLLDEKLKREELIVNTLQRLDKLKKQMYIQTKSYDEIFEKAKEKARMLASIPAIQPISNKDLKLFASGFGMRMHPIYKVMKMHTGCDFTAPHGSPVYATGDGVVISSEAVGGYGNQVEIDHGFGYVTRYAHLSTFKVKKGQKVKRGQKIGEVGSTGVSVSPHLHYEIEHNGIKIDPVNYFFNDLSPAQYEKLLEIAKQERQSMGGGY